MNWNLNPLAFFEFFVVIAFALGWWILEWYANRVGTRHQDGDLQGDPPREPADASSVHDEAGGDAAGGDAVDNR